jgi:hypothetical protein
MDMHPFLIAQLADQRRTDLLHAAEAARRADALGRDSLPARWEAALTRVTARVRRPAATPVCCPA